jgi:hypothetical protein
VVVRSNVKNLLVLLAILFCTVAYSQKKNEAYKLHIRKATAPIIVDGILDEADWLSADVAADFYMALPMDTSYANVRTEVRMTYDDVNLYLIALNFHAVAGSQHGRVLAKGFHLWQE